MSAIEILGYVGSVLVAVSLMMSSIVKLRVINLVGASVFSAYGFIIGALPVGFLNGFIVLVDIYYIIEIFTTKEYFRVLEVKYDSEYLKYFLQFHADEIKKYMPTFSFEPGEHWIVLFILRDTVPAGLVCAEYHDSDHLFLNLDFAIPGYRDFKVGKYVFPRMFERRKVKKIYSDPGNEKHERYLKRMGFVKTELDSNTVYALEAK
ncbi:MAG: hypothetical protein CVV24_12195 [Ignavibacteriae bacterium HGW-Ignavibacteriae-3]|nr:MAG: hypothetical protein CVV24_12195 [Ignavibacteriae bacterium HGW-Ignavibacteriae-3]